MPNILFFNIMISFNRLIHRPPLARLVNYDRLNYKLVWYDMWYGSLRNIKFVASKIKLSFDIRHNPYNILTFYFFSFPSQNKISPTTNFSKSDSISTSPQLRISTLTWKQILSDFGNKKWENHVKKNEILVNSYSFYRVPHKKTLNSKL